MTKFFDRETLYQKLANKEWVDLAKFMFSHGASFKSDPVVMQAFSLFESEFLKGIQTQEPNEQLAVMEYPNLIIELNKHGFSDDFVNNFIDEKLKLLLSLKKDSLLSYALSHQSRPLALQIVKDIQANVPEEISNARRENVTIKSTQTKSGKAQTLNLFKSKQEQSFFEAIREAFPTYHPYPNVALSCVLDFNAIKGSLTNEQQDYFFKAIVDSVVFDNRNGYAPMYFFELDSPFHDNAKARGNDAMKDAIFLAANVKLIRIRAYTAEEATVSKFKELVFELMR